MDDFKKSDLIGVMYIVVITALVVIYLAEVGEFSGTHPLFAGFMKFALLASFGECLKARITNGTWRVDYLILRAVIWG